MMHKYNFESKTDRQDHKVTQAYSGYTYKDATLKYLMQ